MCCWCRWGSFMGEMIGDLCFHSVGSEQKSMEKWRQRPGDLAVPLLPVPHFGRLYSQLCCSHPQSLLLPSQWMDELGSGSSLLRTRPTGTARILSAEMSSSSGHKPHLRPCGENRQGCLGRRRRRKGRRRKKRKGRRRRAAG